MTIVDDNGDTVFDITANAGQAETVSGASCSRQGNTRSSSPPSRRVSPRPALSYTVQGGVLSQPMGPIVHNPTYQPIYLGPPGPITIDPYPTGTISTIPFLWVSPALSQRLSQKPRRSLQGEDEVTPFRLSARPDGRGFPDGAVSGHRPVQVPGSPGSGFREGEVDCPFSG